MIVLALMYEDLYLIFLKLSIVS